MGSVEILEPPQAESRCDLRSYIMTEWCPWFSRTFGVLSEANLNMLTVRLLRAHVEEGPVQLELLAAALIVLKAPNTPHAPTCREPSRAVEFLCRQLAE